MLGGAQVAVAEAIQMAVNDKVEANEYGIPIDSCDGLSINEVDEKPIITDPSYSNGRFKVESRFYIHTSDGKRFCVAVTEEEKL